MQVYRLEPKSDTARDQNWSTTRLKERCWVRARSETDARLKLTLVTGIAIPLRAGKRFVTSPWIDRDLTNCTLDECPYHEVLTDHEKIPIQVPPKPN
jgi:hypothetical protein